MEYTDLQDSLTADIDVGKLPLHPDPPGIASGHLVVDLLPHQSQALQASLPPLPFPLAHRLIFQWMIGQENPKLPATPEDSAVQFWAKQKGDPKAGGGEYWLNVATRTPQKDTPKLGRGGILADGMGLGKTSSWDIDAESKAKPSQCFRSSSRRNQIRRRLDTAIPRLSVCNAAANERYCLHQSVLCRS